MVYFIILDTDGDISEHELNFESKDKQKPFTKLFRAKKVKDMFTEKMNKLGTGKISEITKYKINNDSKLLYYGFLKGKVENNHELPNEENSEDKPNVYGDIILIKVNQKEQLLDINAQDYETLYNSIFYNNFSDNEQNDYSDDESIETNLIKKKNKVPDDIDEDDFLEHDENDENEEEEEEGLLEDEEEDEEEDGNQDYGNDLSDEDFEEEKDNIDNDNDVDILEQEEEDLCEISDDINEIRKNNISILNRVINNMNKTKIIEESIFRFTCEKSNIRKVIKKWENPIFRKIYINKSRSLYMNLNKDSYIKNTSLISKINSNKFDLENIAFMTYQELFPEHWKKLLDEKYKREAVMYEDKTEAMTDMFKCGRCKQRKCTYYELQTRSADEGMTIFITCVNCGNRWRQ